MMNTYGVYVVHSTICICILHIWCTCIFPLVPFYEMNLFTTMRCVWVYLQSYHVIDITADQLQILVCLAEVKCVGIQNQKISVW